MSYEKNKVTLMAKQRIFFQAEKGTFWCRIEHNIQGSKIKLKIIRIFSWISGVFHCLANRHAISQVVIYFVKYAPRYITHLS